MNSSKSSMFIGGLCWMPSVKNRENFVPRLSLHQATWNINNEHVSKQNIAKGITDPRVEFIFQK